MSNSNRRSTGRSRVLSSPALLAAILAMVVLALSACGTSEEGDDDDDDDAPTPTVSFVPADGSTVESTVGGAIRVQIKFSEKMNTTGFAVASDNLEQCGVSSSAAHEPEWEGNRTYAFTALVLQPGTCSFTLNKDGFVGFASLEGEPIGANTKYSLAVTIN